MKRDSTMFFYGINKKIQKNAEELRDVMHGEKIQRYIH